MRLYVSVSAHGYGHIAQTGPVLEAWLGRHPDTRVTLACDAPPAVLRKLLRIDFDLLPGVSDPGMCMGSALDVLPEQSHQAYLKLHRDWDHRLAAETRRIRSLRPDLVLANVGCLPLAAAAAAGVPAVALCSLNWADIYQAYCVGMPGFEAVLDRLRQAYAQARRFLVPTPGMWPGWLAQTARIGPIARQGPRRTAALRRALEVSADERLVVINGGGLEMRLPVEHWPPFERVRWLVPDHWRLASASIHPYAASGLGFRDMLLASDAVLTKPGYGMFADAGCNGLPVLYIPRGDWPEEPCLVEWLQEHGRVAAVDRALAISGGFEALLTDLWQRPIPPPPKAGGAAEAVEQLTACLG